MHINFELRDKADGEAVAGTIRSAGSEAHFIAVDISKGDQVEVSVAQIVARYGKLDCTFNNAGIEGPTAFIIGQRFRLYPLIELIACGKTLS